MILKQPLKRWLFLFVEYLKTGIKSNRYAYAAGRFTGSRPIDLFIIQMAIEVFSKSRFITIQLPM